MSKFPIKDSYKPADAAKAFGVTTNTIRNWCIRYEKFLSPDATPAKGKTRVFTQRDMNVLAIINDGVNKKENTDEITQTLTDRGEEIPRTIDESLTTPESPQDAQEPPGQPLAPVVDASTLGPLLTAMQENTVTAERLQQTTGRLDRQGQQIDQLRLLFILAIIIMTLLIVAVVVALLVMR